MNENKTQTNLEIKQVLSEPYKYGFQTDIETESFPFGLNEDIVKLISEKKEEPDFLLDFRLKSYRHTHRLCCATGRHDSSRGPHATHRKHDKGCATRDHGHA